MEDDIRQNDNVLEELEKVNYDAWEEFFSYYRYYIDEFAIDVLGLTLYPYQRLWLRAMGRYQNSMGIACRGLGKSFIVSVFYICSSILYPRLTLGIGSATFDQARNVIKQYFLNGVLSRNENIKREIDSFGASNNCFVKFKNGSIVHAISVNQRGGGDTARSWRFQYLFIDEARLMRDLIIEDVLIPMTKTKRDLAIRHNVPEKGKVIFGSSAHLKISQLYSRFKFHYEQMISGGDYWVGNFPSKIGIKYGLFEQDDIDQEREKPSRTLDSFLMEFEGVFIGSSSDSYYPYEITVDCQVIPTPEISQPKKTSSQYIITHDVALSDKKGSDNACTHVIKLKEKPNGGYYKNLVYTFVTMGMSLPEQRDFLRQLVHLRFPNTVKLVVDTRGSGEAMPSLLCESWEYIPESGPTLEFPPIVRDDDEQAAQMNGAMPILRCITATNDFNVKFYPYLKACFQDRSLRVLKSAASVDSLWKEEKITPEEYAVYLEHDALISELSNIKETVTKFGATVYDRIVKKKKRDRTTSLVYGLSVVYELEVENKERFYAASSKYDNLCFFDIV